jgi:hypothetical protein
MAKNQDGTTLFRKLNRLFKNSNQLRRKVKSKDTALVVPDKTKSSGVLLFQKSTTPSYATITSNAYNLSERLMRYQDFCFGKDTLVYTLNGVFTIEELTKKYSQGERFFVYSYDYENKKPVIGTAFSPRITNDAQKVSRIRVSFDDGFVDLTPEHRVILRDGSTKEAKDLNINDSLMPLYVSDINGFGYNWVYMLSKQQTSSGWLQEHRLIASQFFGEIPEDYVVHHHDFNRKNNHPSNLKIMHEDDHSRYHAQLNNVNKSKKTNQKNHNWMKQHSPNRRFDITFKTIVDTCIQLNTKAILDVKNYLKIDNNAIKLRLKEYGFINWIDFQNRFLDAQKLATHETILIETKSPEYEDIIKLAPECKSLDELACRLSCTRNSINRRLQAWGISGGWTQLKFNKVYDGKKRGPQYSGPSYQDVCSAYQTGMTLQELAIASCSTKGKVGTCLKHNGYVSYTKWMQDFKNHKVLNVEKIDDDVVYTITVEKYHNLAIGSLSQKDNEKRKYSLIFCTQCEMEYTPELASCLDIYSSEICSTDANGRTVHIYSENEKIKDVLEDLFSNILNIEFNLSSWVRNICKYGDAFLYTDVSPEYGIMNVFPIPVNEIEREENYDRDDPFAVRFRWVSLANRILENWEVAHFRLMNNDAFLPYGSSILEPARRIWRQLILAEDSMLVYRVVRSPDRRVFYIDVGNLPSDEVEGYMEQQKRTLRSNQIADSTTNRVDLRYNAMSSEEDYFIPVRGSDSGTKIDTLPGGTNATAVDDVKYLQQKMISALKIPASYLGYTENMSSKASLAQLDVRFSRTISMIQKVIVSELNKLAVIHLFAHGFSSDDLINFSIKLTNPSSIAEQQKLQLWRDRFEIADSAPKGLLSNRWISKNILTLTDYDIREIKREQVQEGGASDEESSGGGGGFGGGSSSSFEDSIFGGAEDETEETTPENPAEETPGKEGEEEIKAGVEPLEDEKDDEIDLILSSDDNMQNKKFPLKPTSRANQVSKHRQTVRHNKSGRADIGMSTNNEIITAYDTNDVFDSDFFRDTTKNNLIKSESVKQRTTIAKSPDMIALFEKMKKKGFGNRNNISSNLLSEGIEVDIDIQDEIDNTTTNVEFEGINIVDDTVGSK